MQAAHHEAREGTEGAAEEAEDIAGLEVKEISHAQAFSCEAGRAKLTLPDAR